MKRIKIRELLSTSPVEQEILVKGWVRTKRGNKNIIFIALNDGSVINNIQVVADTALFDENLLKDITTGACIAVTGKLVESLGQGQSVEIKASAIELYGKCDAETYPLQKKGHSMEFLREHAHLRFRTNTFGAVFRIRHSMAFAVHKYFNDKGFYYLHTPIITGSDAEGAGEMFHVTTLNLKNLPFNEEGMVDFRRFFRLLKEANLHITISLHYEYPLGGVENGSSQLTIERNQVISAMKKDLSTLKGYLQDAGLS